MDPTHAGTTPRVRHVVAVPYPGRGHINPMMNLCKLLAASRGLLITFVVTEEWLGFLGSSPAPPSNLRLRSIPNVIPSELGRAADFSGFIEAVYTKMEEPVDRLLDRLEPPVTGIVADTYLTWAVAVGNRRSVPVYSLWTMAATFFSVLYHFDLIGYENIQLSVDSPEKGDELLEHYVPGITSLKVSDINPILTVGKPLKRALEAFSWVKKAQGVLFTSFYELEAQVIDALRAKLPQPVYPVGPSIPYMTLQENPSMPIQNDADMDYYTWLDSQPKCSVLYVSLGSFLSVSGLQMDEIAMGLRASGVRFLWIARGDDSSRVQEMSGSNGLVVPWCDQLRVLCHSSVGGFLTHCGWNSTLEGVFAGIPFLTLPIFWDQIPDSRLIVDAWRIGLRVKEKVGNEGIIGREQIAKIVKKLMDLDGVESIEMRRRAMELREASRKAIDEGGSSYTNLDAFVSDLMCSQCT